LYDGNDKVPAVEGEWCVEALSLPQLAELEALRGNPVIVYHSPVNVDTVHALYECLRKMGTTPRLDFVLSTGGGMVTTAHRIALLLREFTEHVTILVPYPAMSAGTLLCLSANELVLGPMAELGPIDPHIGSAGTPALDVPGTISAEDIRTFRQMAEDWFGVNREEDRLQVLGLVAQRIFPTSISSFYRADRMARAAALELLRYQLPEAEPSIRERIVSQLVGGYGAHSYVITRAEAKKLGLRVKFASPQEEALLWRLSRTIQRQFSERPGPSGEVSILSLIMSKDFCARKVQSWSDPPEAQDMRTGETQGEPSLRQRILSTRWEMDGE
jgi:hypothetical protein